MHPGTSLGEKFADRRVLPKRRQQLDLSFAHLQKSCREPVLLVAGTVRELSPKKRGVKLDRRLEMSNRNTDMVKLHFTSPLAGEVGREAAGWGDSYLYHPSPVFRPSLPALTLASSCGDGL